MPSPVISLTFTDGHTEQVTLNPRVLVEVERKFQGNIPPMEGSLYGAWHRLGRPGDFEGWLDSVTDIDQGEATAPTPTEPGPSDAS